MDLGVLLGQPQDIALLWMEVHEPLLLPSLQFGQVILQLLPIIHGADGQVHDGIIGKQADAGMLGVLAEVINEDQEQDGAQHGPLWKNPTGD